MNVLVLLTVFGVFTLLHSQESPPPLQAWVHHTLILESAAEFSKGTAVGAETRQDRIYLSPVNSQIPSTFESAPLTREDGFHEVLLSFNAEIPKGSGVGFDVRVRKNADDTWTPWLRMVEWGEIPADAVRETKFEGGSVDVDILRSSTLFRQITWRVSAFREKTSGTAKPIVVHRVALTLSRKEKDTPFDSGSSQPVSLPAALRRLPVPFRSQTWEDREIAGHVCSPTSTAMVAEFRGARTPTAKLAEVIRDPVHKIYGNWPRAVQGAFTLGIPGYLTRISKWSAVEKFIAAGQPLIITIGVKDGELDGAPYKTTQGHLVVICGFDDQGRALMNDPAGRDKSSGQPAYRRDQLDRVWLSRGGTAYILESRRNR